MTCTKCNGTGGLYSFVGGVELDQPCQSCNGTGEVIYKPTVGCLFPGECIVAGEHLASECELTEVSNG
jgi:DnaJ-class molecular chaperone